MSAQQPSLAMRLFGTEVGAPPAGGRAGGSRGVARPAGALRYIRFRGVEVLRAIAYLVRDKDWGTYAPEIRGLETAETADGFRVTYEAAVAGGDFTFAAEIVGRRDGSLSFSATGTAHKDLVTNRTGFVVLHPLTGVAGRPVKVEHVDGRTETAEFPTIVNPLQPFYDIRALSHETLPGLWAECRFEGDTWEMEDHRNWTDASFKTYVRPLAKPWPYTIAAGTSFTQSVTLRFTGRAADAPATAGAQAARIELGRPGGAAVPRIGLGVPAAEAAGALAAIDLLKAAAPQLLVCQLDLRQGHGGPEVDRYRALRQATGAEIVLEIVIPGDDPRRELAQAAEAAKVLGERPGAVAVSPAADLKAVLPGSKGPKVPPLEEIYAAARAAFPGVTLGGGTFAYFTELNRKRPPAGLLDYVTHTTCPTVHAADDRSVMETLESLPYVIASVRGFVGDTPYRVGPSAICARDNPYGAATAPNPGNRRMCLADRDPRQKGLFGAAWYLGYLAAFARGGVDAVSVAAPTGPYGIIAAPGEPMRVYPAWHVIAGIARGAGRRLVPVASSRPTAIDGIAWEGERGPVLWLANLTGTDQTVELTGLSGPVVLRLLDQDSFVPATSKPQRFADSAHQVPDVSSLTLKPYAVACIEAG
ncbi:MAG: hypothetical protein IRY94_10435 [Rhodospirillaceae bacterium]|nr:hypothetical protein [Rhodospirillaceae bacterium]